MNNINDFGKLWLYIYSDTFNRLYIDIYVTNEKPKESYYSANRFLVAPSLIIAWFRGVGSFEQTLAILSLCISVAMWGTLIHDLPMSILSALKVINANQHEIAMNSPTIWRSLLWTTFAIYLSAFMILFYKCVRTVHKLSPASSIFIALFSFITFQLIFLIFNR